MATRYRRMLILAVLVLGSGGVTLTAADLDQALREADGRRKAAESGVREIKTKSKDQADQVRSLYAEAASRNNAWLDMVCQSIQQAPSSAPDVSAAVEPAATALVQWVSARNRALGLPELTGPIADSVKKRVTQDLTDIANETWRGNRSGNEQRRTQAANALKERLQWRGWEDLR